MMNRSVEEVFYFVEVKYIVNGGQNEEATALLNVTVRSTMNELMGPVAFVSEPQTYVNETMLFVYLAVEHHPTMRYEVDYGDGKAPTTFDASGSISPIPEWAGAAAAAVFERDVQRCRGSVLEHVYRRAGEYTARVRVSADQQVPGESDDELVLTASVTAVVRSRYLSQVMSTARVYRRLPNYRDEYVLMLFRVDEFPRSLSLSVDFGENNEVPYAVTRMSDDDDIPKWFTDGSYVDVTTRTSVVTPGAASVSSHDRAFFGAIVGKWFAGPGTYDVQFIVEGILSDAEGPERVVIVARVDVMETRLESQLAGGPLLFAHSPVSSGTTTELLVVVRRLIKDVTFTVDYGDGTVPQPVVMRAFPVTKSDLPDWLLDRTFSSPESFSLTNLSVTFYGRLVRHLYREPGFYSAVVEATASFGGHCQVLQSPATIIYVVDTSTPPLSELLGDDALLVPTPLLVERGFHSFYISMRNVADARYAFTFGDGTGEHQGRPCSEWPLIDRSNGTIAGRLLLKEARKGSAKAVCVSHVYASPDSYNVRVRVYAPPSGVSRRTWNLGGRVTVLRSLIAETTSVSSLCHVPHPSADDPIQAVNSCSRTSDYSRRARR